MRRSASPVLVSRSPNTEDAERPGCIPTQSVGTRLSAGLLNLTAMGFSPTLFLQLPRSSIPCMKFTSPKLYIRPFISYPNQFGFNLHFHHFFYFRKHSKNCILRSFTNAFFCNQASNQTSWRNIKGIVYARTV